MNGGFKLRRFLADDLVYLHRLHAVGLKLGKGLARIIRVQLFGIANQHKASRFDCLGNTKQVTYLVGAGQRGFINHDHLVFEFFLNGFFACFTAAPVSVAVILAEELLQGT